MARVSRTSSSSHSYTYNGKELEAETGWHDYGQRVYDQQIGRFNKVDRFANKYMALSSYQYGTNNPIKYIDVNGDSLKLNNAQRSLQDLKLLVKERYRDRISLDENNYLLVDISDLREGQVKRDKGLDLLQEISSSDVKILYSSAEIEEFEDGQGVILVGKDPNGVVNASSKGKDSNGKNTIQPKEGFDGQLSITLYGSWNTNGGKSRQSVLFHELAENYYRSSGIDYDSKNGKPGAHELASRREGGYFGNNEPGSIIRFNKSQFSHAQKEVYNFIFQNWNEIN